MEQRDQPRAGEEPLEDAEPRILRTASAPDSAAAAAESDRLLHELRACQIKLEMQNVELQQARLAVKKAQEKYADLYDFVPFGYFALDDRGIVTEANRTGMALLGTTHTNLVGHRFSIFLAEQSRTGFNLFLEKVLADGQAAVCEAALGGGTHVQWVRICGRAVQTLENERRQCRIAVTDITAVRDAEGEQEFLRAQIQQTLRLESLGVLAGGIAHDFNNMLMIISGNARLVLEGLPADSPARPMAGEIIAVSARAADLCAQMLSHAGKGHSQMAPLSLSTMAAEIIGLLAVSMTNKTRISGRLGENLPPVLADAVQMRQVLMNLIINASEALGESGGTILVSTGLKFFERESLARTRAAEPLKEGYHVFLEVADTVGGMDLGTLERMFDPSFSLKSPGKGPGLAAVTGIIHAHAGGICVDSRVGRGATITLLLPPAQGVGEADPGPPAVAVGWKGKGTVLLVDDEDSVRLVCQHMLESLGLDVLSAKDGREAIRTFCEHRNEIGCVLLDFAMPRLNGEETFRELHRIDPKARVILSSGYLLDDVMARFKGDGLAGFIHKPYLMEQLVEAMKKVFTA